MNNMKTIFWCVLFLVIGCIVGSNAKVIGFCLDDHNSHTYMHSSRNVAMRGVEDDYEYMKNVFHGSRYNCVELLSYSLIMKYQYHKSDLVEDDMCRILKISNVTCDIDSIYKAETK